MRVAPVFGRVPCTGADQIGRCHSHVDLLEGDVHRGRQRADFGEDAMKLALVLERPKVCRMSFGSGPRPTGAKGGYLVPLTPVGTGGPGRQRGLPGSGHLRGLAPEAGRPIWFLDAGPLRPRLQSPRLWAAIRRQGWHPYLRYDWHMTCQAATGPRGSAWYSWSSHAISWSSQAMCRRVD